LSRAPRNDDRCDLVPEPLGGYRRRSLRISRGENVEEVTGPAARTRRTLRDDAIDQPPPTPAEAGARDIGWGWNAERQQEIDEAGACQTSGIAQDQLAQFGAVMPHIERKDRTDAPRQISNPTRWGRPG